jgi:hypothetical protein
VEANTNKNMLPSSGKFTTKEYCCTPEATLGKEVMITELSAKVIDAKMLKPLVLS